MSNGGHVILDVWIAIEKLVAPAPDEGSGKQKDDHRDGECDAQRRNTSLFNYRYHHRTIRFHAKKLSALSIDCSYSSGGFSAATEGRIASPSSEVNATSSR